MIEEGSIRLSSEATVLLNRLSGNKSVSFWLDTLVELCSLGCIELIYKVTEYNSSTGKPAKLKWTAWEKWDGRLWLNFFNSPCVNQKDAENLITFLKGKPPVLLEKNGRFYIIEYIEVYEIEENSPQHFRVREVRKPIKA